MTVPINKKHKCHVQPKNYLQAVIKCDINYFQVKNDKTYLIYTKQRNIFCTLSSPLLIRQILYPELQRHQFLEHLGLEVKF